MVLLRPCRTTAAFEAIPEEEIHLDLARVEEHLIGAGWETVANAIVLLVVRKEIETTIYPSGKVLLKTQDRSAAERVWKDLEPALGEGGMTHGS